MSAHVKLLAVVALGLAASSAATSAWTSCGGAWAVEDVSLTPSSPSRGQPLFVNITALSSAAGPAVTGGSFQARVYYAGFNVYSASNELCATVACPVQPGERVAITSTQSMPGWAPRGSYRFRFEGSLPVSAGSQLGESRVGHGAQDQQALRSMPGADMVQQGQQALPAKGGLMQQVGSAAGQAQGEGQAWRRLQQLGATSLLCVEVRFNLS
ncbi:hypothetical protein V8C86DRAFT_3128813 [Haematococcus lacustris]